MMVTLAVLKLDYGPMKLHEENAVKRGDIYTTPDRPFKDAETEAAVGKGGIIDLVLPVVVLIFSCVAGMVYTGGFFSGTPFITAFAECDASLGLALGSFITLLFAFCFFVFRGVLTFKDFSEAIPKGFIAMVPAILILILAWSLSGMTGLLGGAEFVSDVLESSAGALNNFIPVIVFLLASGLSFATGTSWGTFGILLPIAVSVMDPSSELMVITISACLAGAVFGDHCSPISDTTIMSSTGAQCEHINHVSTQLPYALLVAVISLVMYFIAVFVQNALVTLPIGIAVTVLALMGIKRFQR